MFMLPNDYLTIAKLSFVYCHFSLSLS